MPKVLHPEQILTLKVNEKNNKKTKLPIINAVYDILYEGKNPKKVFQKLTEKLD